MDSQYTFQLCSVDSGEMLTLEQAPIGWNAQKINIIRDLVYLGILKALSVEFEFVGAGYLFAQKHRLRYGIDSYLILFIYNSSDNSFVIKGKVNNEKFLEDRKFRKFKVDILQSGLIQKFNNREDTKLNILNTVSMDRKPITPTLLSQALIRGKAIQFYSKFDGPINTPEIYHHIISAKLVQNGNPGVNEVSNVYISEWITDAVVDSEHATNNPMKLVENAFYTNVLNDNQTINLKTHINVTMEYKGTVNLGPSDSEQNFCLFRLWRCNADNTIVDQFVWKQLSLRNGSVTIDLDYDNPALVMQPGQYLIYIIERWGRPIPIGFSDPIDTADMDTYLRTEFTYNAINIEITQASVVADSPAPVLLPFELFENLFVQICGGTFKSNTFGRIDRGYAVDGPNAYLATTLGEWLRGIPISETQFNTSFRDAFKSYSSVLCLGAQIIGDEIQVELLDDLFNHNVAASLGEVEELGIEPASEFLFNRVKAGYPENEYEQENGRDEINTPYQYTNSFQSVNKELDLISVYCGDGYGIEFARRAGIITTGTQDSRYDGKIFFVDLIKDDDGNLMTRRLEGILFISGVFSPETMINARIAVGQNMLRWKRYLNIPMDKKNNRSLFFQSKAKNSGLVLITDLGESTDNKDIALGNKALFLSTGKRFKVPLTIQSMAGIMLNPLGLINFTYEDEEFFDYLLNVDVETDKHFSTWRTLATRDTPPDIEMDPQYGDYIKYGDGLSDLIKYGDGPDDFIKYK